MKAELEYINFDYIPKWQEVQFPFSVKNAIAYDMYCATLPTTYLIRMQNHNIETPYSDTTELFQITFLESRNRSILSLKMWMEKKVVRQFNVPPHLNCIYDMEESHMLLT